MIAVSDILLRCADALLDEDHVRWPVPELLRWMNDGAGEIVLRRPPAGTVTETLALVDGTRQTIPDNGIQLLDVVRNLSHPQHSVQRASRHSVESIDRYWHSGVPEQFIRNFCIDDRQPEVFYVWPYVAEGTEVEVVYTRQPDPVTAEDGTLNLRREYVGPLMNYILYRCAIKDSENGDLSAATAHYQAFNEALGANTQMQMVVTPKAQEA